MSKLKNKGLYVMSVIYIAAGINHFINPGLYKKIMPPWLPAHDLLIMISGIGEVLLGVLLIPALTRKWASWGVIILVVAIFPANIQMMLNYYQSNHPYLWMAVLRLPVQLLLIVWAYSFTKIGE